MVCHLLWGGKPTWPFRVGSRASFERLAGTEANIAAAFHEEADAAPG